MSCYARVGSACDADGWRDAAQLPDGRHRRQVLHRRRQIRETLAKYDVKIIVTRLLTIYNCSLQNWFETSKFYRDLLLHSLGQDTQLYLSIKATSSLPNLQLQNHVNDFDLQFTRTIWSWKYCLLAHWRLLLWPDVHVAANKMETFNHTVDGQTFCFNVSHHQHLIFHLQRYGVSVWALWFLYCLGAPIVYFNWTNGFH